MTITFATTEIDCHYVNKYDIDSSASQIIKLINVPDISLTTVKLIAAFLL